MTALAFVIVGVLAFSAGVLVTCVVLVTALEQDGEVRRYALEAIERGDVKREYYSPL